MSTIGRATAAQITAWQNAFAATCDTTCTVQRNANLGVPNTDASWGNVSGLVNIKCIIERPQGSFQQQLASQLVDESTWTISFTALDSNGAATDVRRGDRVLIQGLTLTVQHVFSPQSLSINQAVLASTPR